MLKEETWRYRGFLVQIVSRGSGDDDPESERLRIQRADGTARIQLILPGLLPGEKSNARQMMDRDLVVARTAIDWIINADSMGEPERCGS